MHCIAAIHSSWPYSLDSVYFDTLSSFLARINLYRLSVQFVRMHVWTSNLTFFAYLSSEQFSLKRINFTLKKKYCLHDEIHLKYGRQRENIEEMELKMCQLFYQNFILRQSVNSLRIIQIERTINALKFKYNFVYMYSYCIFIHLC